MIDNRTVERSIRAEKHLASNVCVELSTFHDWMGLHQRIESTRRRDLIAHVATPVQGADGSQRNLGKALGITVQCVKALADHA